MPQYGDVIYNPQLAYVAPLLSNNTFGNPVLVDYLDTFTFEYESDTDLLMSGGMVVETLTIPKNINGELTQGSLDYAAWTVMTGFGATEYGVAPNRYYITDARLGGEGLPYFSLICLYAATNGANVLIGIPKMKLDTPPGFDSEQNKFRIGRTSFKGVAPSVINRGAVRYKKFETAGAVPTSAAGFLQFFTTPINIMA